MDDLVGESGLDDSNLNPKLKLKYYNKALVSYLAQQGLNMNPLKLSARQLKEKHTNVTSLFSHGNPINSAASSNSSIETFITGNGQILFLPFNPQRKKRRRGNIRDEYNDDDDHHDHDNDPEEDHDDVDAEADENDNDEQDDDNEGDERNMNPEADEPYAPEDLECSPRKRSFILGKANRKSRTARTQTNASASAIPNDQPSHAHNITNHTFSVIVKLNKKCNLNKMVKVNYHTHSTVKWIPPEYSRKEPIDERFRTSDMIDWDLNLANPDCYIPFKESAPHTLNMNSDDTYGVSNVDTNTLDDSLESDSMSLDSINNGNLTPLKKVVDVKFSNEPTQEIKTFKSLNPKDYINEPPLLSSNENLVESNLFKGKNHEPTDSSSDSNESFLPGYYIFLLPVVYPLNTPESIQVPNSLLSHEFTIQIQKGTIVAPTLQAPQSAFLSTSPSHHYKYDDQNFEFEQRFTPSHTQNIIPPPIGTNSNSNNTHNSKSSFFKKIGIHKSTSSNSKLDSSISKHNSISPRGSFSSSHNTAVSINENLHSRTRSSSASQGNPIVNFLHQSSNTPTIYNYSYKLPAVRLPPSDATSTLNKSIYVKKVWNKALNYELLLPKKFTQLSPPSNVSVSPNDKFLHDNTFLLQMKLVPLVKNLQLKRIKINIVEKVTYTPKSPNSKDHKVPKSRTTDKTVTMLEIKTKDKSNNSNVNKPNAPLKTQIIKGCVNDNLLTFCYNNEKSSCFKESDSSHGLSNSSSMKISSGFLHGSKKMSRFLDNSLSISHNPITGNNHNTNNNIPQNQDDIVITNPVKLQCPLNFVANDDSKFIQKVYEHLCTGTSDLNGLHDGSDYVDRGNDTMSIFSVNSAGNDKSDVFSDDDQAVSRSPVRRQRNFSFSSTSNNNLGTSARNNLSNPNWSSVQHEDKANSHTFLPDTTFSNLKVRHRLQISFRISRPDPKIKNSDGEFKLHHYEVIVDTPIVFVSPFCVTEALDLPSYEDAVRIGMFEVAKNSSKFAMSHMNENDSNYGSGYGYESSSSDENAVFSPCSPLMSDSNVSPMLYSTTDGANNSSAQVTNLLATSITSTMSSLPAYENRDPSFNRKRSDSGCPSLPGTTPVNASSLLSAAFSRSKECSTSLNSVLASDFSNLSLGNATGVSNRNTIDGVIGVDTEAPPPEYTEIGFNNIKDINKNVDLHISSTTSEFSTPSILAFRSESTTNGTDNIDLTSKESKEAQENKGDMSAIKNYVAATVRNSVYEKENLSKKNLSSSFVDSPSLSGSRTSLKSERVALLSGAESSGFKANARNSTVESEMSAGNSFDLGERDDLESIINMNMGQIPTLNLTPTQNGI